MDKGCASSGVVGGLGAMLVVWCVWVCVWKTLRSFGAGFALVPCVTRIYLHGGTIDSRGQPHPNRTNLAEVPPFSRCHARCLPARLFLCRRALPKTVTRIDTSTCLPHPSNFWHQCVLFMHGLLSTAIPENPARHTRHTQQVVIPSQPPARGCAAAHHSLTDHTFQVMPSSCCHAWSSD